MDLIYRTFLEVAVKCIPQRPPESSRNYSRSSSSKSSRSFSRIFPGRSSFGSFPRSSYGSSSRNISRSPCSSAFGNSSDFGIEIHWQSLWNFFRSPSKGSLGNFFASRYSGSFARSFSRKFHLEFLQMFPYKFIPVVLLGVPPRYKILRFWCYTGNSFATSLNVPAQVFFFEELLRKFF